jgi:hypothetical protein
MMRTFRDYKHVVYLPPSQEEFENLLAGLKAASLAGGRAIVVIDEIYRWAYPYPSPLLRECFQAHRHVWENLTVLYTSQYVGYLQSDLLNCIDAAYIFRTQSFRSLKRIEEEYGVPPEQVEALHFPPPPLDYLYWRA